MLTAGVLPDEKIWQALRPGISTIWPSYSVKIAVRRRSQPPAWKRLPRPIADMVQATRTVVYSRGQQLQQEIAERGQFFGWQALVLFLLSLALVLLFTRMIIGPVKGIERMINRTGGGEVAGRRRAVYRSARAALPSVNALSG
ncbi:sensor-like histidine kinase YfhK [Klebsiella michiganensis]|uniref:Sensor-like histidine kinase YfhK n=1 Tax=Klebsiella michiganensis TaxID=1134687 RepID=A0A7H4PN80_9ENTR|nr:sensor-like histidine kinase YfhK [Klebsiella michiganensis]